MAPLNPPHIFTWALASWHANVYHLKLLQSKSSWFTVAWHPPNDPAGANRIPQRLSDEKCSCHGIPALQTEFAFLRAVCSQS